MSFVVRDDKQCPILHLPIEPTFTNLKNKTPIIQSMQTPSTVQFSVQVDAPPTSHNNSNIGNHRVSKLHAVAWEGNTTLLEEILRTTETPDVRDESNVTPIMSTLMRHSLQDTRCIFRDRQAIQRNLVVDCREEDAERVATTSAVLNLLLQFGADPDARSNRNQTALHYATSDGLYEVARILLDAGATIDAQDKDGRSPLHCALQEPSLLVTNLLVSQGASIDLQDNNGVSPLSFVIQKGDVEAMQIFLNHHALVATRERLDFAGEVLLQAVEAKSAAIVKFLVEKEYTIVDYQNSAGETALHRAIAQKDTQMMETLRALDTSGRSLRAVTTRGEFCFHFAARTASAVELSVLLEFWQQVAGAEDRNLLNVLNASGATSLFVASTTTEAASNGSNNDQMVDRHVKMKLLIRHGARLFRFQDIPGDPVFRPSCQTSGIVLCAQVWRCLVQWFSECQDESDADLVVFCTKWIANVPDNSNTTTQMTSVLTLSVCAGYGVEILPLLLMLPQERTAIPQFLQSLEVFKNSSNGLQFDCLIREVSASVK